VEASVGAGEVLGFINVFGAGLLAGEEFVIRYGVRGPLGRLDQESHIRMRQGLIRTLRILVPAILLPTLLSAVAVTVVDGADGGREDLNSVRAGLAVAAFALLLAGLVLS
jgi:hypothetical protein